MDQHPTSPVSHQLRLLKPERWMVEVTYHLDADCNLLGCGYSITCEDELVQIVALGLVGMDGKSRQETAINAIIQALTSLDHIAPPFP